MAKARKPETLARERACYASHLAEWLVTYPGRFVLVKGDELVGAFDTMEDALREGARRFGLQAFLVRRVVSEQEEVRVPALTLGLLTANPTHSVRS
ncbi:MAG TPA: hypothetical protein DEV93_22335 [Chloroflexi bacterium]|jgi:hypothetical protein|nr:hypothetical protein [Chloroflexota bacterium]